MEIKNTEYLKVMENLFCEYELSLIKLEERISLLTKEKSALSSKSSDYKELYNRIRRLKRCLEETKAWQDMVKKYLVAGGMSDEEIRNLSER